MDALHMTFWGSWMESPINPYFIPHRASNHAQSDDQCVFGITNRMIKRLNRTLDENMLSLHIAKLVSRLHSVWNPVGVIASFRNAGIVWAGAGWDSNSLR
jgi:hypothetical protein